MGFFHRTPLTPDSPRSSSADSTAPFSAMRAAITTPGYRRAVALRRIAAALLLAAAAASALTDRASSDPGVVVFTRAVAPGEVLTPDDIALRPVPADIAPDSALTETADAENQVVASHAAAGEVVTATRLLGEDLIAALVPDSGSYTLVPVKLAEPAIIPMLRHGDEVSVVTAGEEPQGARTIASGGIVVLAGATNADSGSAVSTDTGDGAVLLLLRGGDAETVAAASLSSPLAVVLTSRNIVMSP